MPPKLPETQDERAKRTRTEGRIGKLKVSDMLFRIYGNDKMLEIFDTIKLQTYKAYHFNGSKTRPEDGFTLYFGYCELFEPIPGVEKIPTYDIQIDLEHGGTTVELFKLSE